MDELNRFIEKGTVFRKYYPGATPSEMNEYLTSVLETEVPDTIIIHSGTNSIQHKEVDVIVTNIMKMVQKAKVYGVTNVFVSGMTYRSQFQQKVDLFNKFFVAKAFVSTDFNFISNNNIQQYDIWTDKIHLNNKGVIKIANNFIGAINGTQSL